MRPPLAFLQGAPIHDAHDPRAGQLYDAALFQVRQRAADGLHRHGEVIGDVVARHWKGHAAPAPSGQPCCHFENERADLVDRGDATDNQKLRLQASQCGG